MFVMDTVSLITRDCRKRLFPFWDNGCVAQLQKYPEYNKCSCLNIIYFFCMCIQGRMQGGHFGVKPPPFELDILQKLYYLRKEINCFRTLFAC